MRSSTSVDGKVQREAVWLTALPYAPHRCPRVHLQSHGPEDHVLAVGITEKEDERHARCFKLELVSVGARDDKDESLLI